MEGCFVKKTVILIDRDINLHESIKKRLLLESQLELTYATASGYDAYQKFQEMNSDMLIINIPLLDCDAIQLINAVKAIKENTVIITVLEVEDLTLRSQLQSLGIKAIITKPLILENLISELKKYGQAIDTAMQDVVVTKQFNIGSVNANPGVQNNNFTNFYQENANKAKTSQFGNLGFQTQQLNNQQPTEQQMPFGQQPINLFGQQNNQQLENPFTSANNSYQQSSQNNLQDTFMTLDNNQDNSHQKSIKTIKQQLLAINCSKGGVGKTTVSVNTAIGLSTVRIGKQPLKVLIADLDLDFGDVCATLGLQPQPNIMNWISDINAKLERNPNGIPQYTQSQIEQYLLTYKTGLKILAAPSNHSDLVDVTDKAVQIIIENLKANGGFDVIIFDTGNNTAGYTMYALFTANAVYEIMTMDFTCMNDLHMLLETLKTCNFPMGKLKLVVNRLPKNNREFTIQEISNALHLEVAGVIPDCKSVRVDNNNGNPTILGKENEFTTEIKNLANTMMGVNLFSKSKTNNKKRQKPGLLSKLFG